jgi:hypothetical protein
MSLQNSETKSILILFGMFFKIVEIRKPELTKPAGSAIDPRHFFLRSKPRSSFCEGGRPFMART